MNFKSIQLVGFKSFADKTTIKFQDGVTCIVGPNGCGKSNVSDAVRWVLGEQSAKNLRGSNMQDVIFNGTEERKPMSYSEVTLTFDNTGRNFSVDEDEVSMTRRLYRDGASEYLLNGKTSKRGVLVNLLHDVGIGKEGYTIIGQGKVQQIMNSKPKERRVIFEEATGIVVYKARKQDIENKLRGATQDMYTFLQRMDEVSSQLAPLQKQADTKKKYDEFFRELKANEVNAYIYKYEHAEGNRSAIRNVIADLDAKISALQKRADELLSEYEKCRNSINTNDERLSELNGKLLRYTVNFERKGGEFQRVNDKAQYLKEQYDRAANEVKSGEKRIQQIEQEIQIQKTYADRNGKRMENTQKICDSLVVEINAIKEKIARFEQENDENVAKMLDSINELTAVSETKGSLVAQRKAIEERIEEIKANVAESDVKKTRLQSDYKISVARREELLSEIDKLKNDLDERQQENEDNTDRIALVTQQIYNTNSQIATLNENLKMFKSLRDRFDGYKTSVKKLLLDAKTNEQIASKIKGMISDIVRCEEKYETAIETAFGGAMQNIVTDNADDAKSLIEYLKRTGGGVVTFLPVKALRPHHDSEQIAMALKEQGALGLATKLVKYDPYYENVIGNLLGNTIICDNIANATTIAKRFPRQFRIVTLDGDVIATSGAMTGGSRKQDVGNLLSSERQIAEAEKDISNKQENVKRLQLRKKQLEEKKVELSGQLEKANASLQRCRMEYAQLEQKQNSVLEAVSETETNINVYNGAIAMLEKKLSSLRDEMSGSENKVATPVSLSQNEEYENLKAERDEKLKKYNSSLVEIASLSASIESAKQNEKRLLDEKKEIIQKNEDIAANMENIAKNIDDYRKMAERAAMSDEEKKVIDDLHAEIDAITKEKQTINARIQKIDDEKLDITVDIDTLKDEKHKQDLELAKIDSDLSALEERITEMYGETYESCLEYKMENFDPASAQTEINKLKRKISALGEINHAALSEYEALSKRYEGMQVQKEDLSKAIDDLSTALTEVKSEMQNIFDKGFEEINKNFMRTFKELFGGGRAELQLDYEDCDDPLDAGVEIVACPPGKTLKKNSLLSGGEMALTAIAILFAILRSRPMPFVILDEVEAALDESNVGVFADYLKKYSKDTQFIVITHRKPTMEKGDTLFGVTMEEKGVSKIVSVKFSEVESRLGADAVTNKAE